MGEPFAGITLRVDLGEMLPHLRNRLDKLLSVRNSISDAIARTSRLDTYTQGKLRESSRSNAESLQQTQFLYNALYDRAMNGTKEVELSYSDYKLVVPQPRYGY